MIYSFPVQLLFLHLRNNLLLIGMWVFVWLLLTGKVANLYGVKFLFLSPEYMGEVGFKSFFLLGTAFGGFFMTWNLATYLLDAHHFPFLASMKRPFTKFILNNFIVPLTFLSFYFTYTIWFQRYFEYWSSATILANCISFLLGFVLLLTLSSAYFRFTNKDIFNFSKRVRLFAFASAARVQASRVAVTASLSLTKSPTMYPKLSSPPPIKCC